jgi:hypothetical protein
VRTHLIAGLVASVLCACGGGSDPASPIAAAKRVTSPASPDIPAAPSGPASTPVVTVVIYGDDQMEGVSANQFGIMSIVSPNESAALQTLLQAHLNDTGVTVTNAATGGTASSLQNELDGMDGGGQPEPARMVASGARIAIQQHMLNDAQANGIQPVLEEDSPVCDGNHPALPSYVAAMDAVAAQYNVPVIREYAYIESLPDWQSHMLNCVVPDAYLDGLKAIQEQAVIAPLVKSAFYLDAGLR